MFKFTIRFTTILAMLVLAAALTACTRTNPTGSDVSLSARGNLTTATHEIEFGSRVATIDPASRTLTFTTNDETVTAAIDAEIVRKGNGNETPILFDDILVGDSVEVRGERQPEGTILADRIRVRVDDDDDDGDVEFHSVITGIDLIDSTFTVRDRPEIIHVTPTTRILGRTRGSHNALPAHDGDDDDNSGPGDAKSGDTTISFEALMVGDSVEVDALIIDSATLQATEVELEDRANDDVNQVEFKDHLASVDVAGRTVTFDSQTWIGVVDESADLQDLNDKSVTLDAFMAGQLVEVRGSAGTGDTLWISRMHMDNN